MRVLLFDTSASTRLFGYQITTRSCEISWQLQCFYHAIFQDWLIATDTNILPTACMLQGIYSKCTRFSDGLELIKLVLMPLNRYHRSYIMRRFPCTNPIPVITSSQKCDHFAWQLRHLILEIDTKCGKSVYKINREMPWYSSMTRSEWERLMWS